MEKHPRMLLGAFGLGLEMPQVASAAEKESHDTKAIVDKVQAHVHHDPGNLKLGLWSKLAGNSLCSKDERLERLSALQDPDQFGVGT